MTEQLQIILDFTIFYSVFTLAIFIHYFGKKQEGNKITYDWFFIFAGVLLISFLQLTIIAKRIEVIDEEIFFFSRTLLVLFSSVLITFGVASVVVRKVLEYQEYLRKYNEIKETILLVKEKFLKGKISSEEFKEIIKDLVKEETLLEVKLKKRKK
ncbi:MAG: hypothetical protein RMJ17_04300 [Candidatus Aenigmarchaeota archaeon]|nr:hypothetical protein [Candidatus Aenigmarchaeota archaeon]MDW8149779.1 hypothetical protein [Candidatus Aenigmarchaeota archaeon]